MQPSKTETNLKNDSSLTPVTPIPYQMNLPNEYIKSQTKPIQKTNTIFRIWKGDITTLKIECIVNASNESGLGCNKQGHCIDAAIHYVAGPSLLEACKKLNGIPTTIAKITPGFRLAATWIIHVTGPKKDELTGICDYSLLKKCYINVLNLAHEYKIKRIAFCCISTGIFGFDPEKSADVALNTVRLWLQKPGFTHNIEQVIFNVFTTEDAQIYSNLVMYYQSKGWLGTYSDQKTREKIQNIKEHVREQKT